jgi:hypothetical protein
MEVLDVLPMSAIVLRRREEEVGDLRIGCFRSSGEEEFDIRLEGTD